MTNILCNSAPMKLNQESTRHIIIVIGIIIVIIVFIIIISMHYSYSFLYTLYIHIYIPNRGLTLPHHVTNLSAVKTLHLEWPMTMHVHRIWQLD